MSNKQQEGAANAGTNSAWVHRHLSDSIYLWACGEKADDEEDDIKVSDRLIGWLILFVQGFAYAMLIALVGTSPSWNAGSSADHGGESGYLLPSVTGAMYLLVASTSHDLRVGFSLMVDGSCAGHRVFGICLLVVYGIMLTAAMTVLVSTSDDSASVVLNGVTVLFVADLDEKVLKFLLAVPHEWRLFWAIQSIGISFALALIAIVYVGDASPLLEDNNGILKAFPTWFVWAVNPVGITMCSLFLSSTLHVVCEACTASYESLDEPTFRCVVRKALAGIFTTVMRVKERVRAERCFYVIRGMWLAQGLSNLAFILENRGFSAAFTLAPIASGCEDERVVVTDNKLALLSINAVFFTGLSAKGLGVYLPNHERVTADSEQRCSSGGTGPREVWISSADCRVSSLMVGWGVGYWVTSLLYVLGCSWHGGGCGWGNAPVVVTMVGYVIIPCVLIAGIFMVADTNVLGTRLGVFIEPAVSNLRNENRVEHWIMATVFRDGLIIWIGFCYLLRSALDYW